MTKTTNPQGEPPRDRATPTPASDPVARKRQADLAAIHASAKAMGIDEETRRAMIERISHGRTRTSADLTPGERADLLAEIGGGRKPPRRAGRGPAPAVLDRRRMVAKVGAQLADARLPWGYAEAILRRQRGILDGRIACPLAQATDQELRGVIAALQRHAQRASTAGEGRS